VVIPWEGFEILSWVFELDLGFLEFWSHPIMILVFPFGGIG
jgi:hypothetical protein